MKTFNINLIILKHKMHIVSSFVIFKCKMHTVSSSVIFSKIHKTHHITHHQIRMSSDDSVNVKLNTLNWQAEMLSLKQCLKLSFIFTMKNLIQNYWKKTMIEHALNTTKFKAHFENNNNAENFDNENIVIISNKKKS